MDVLHIHWKWQWNMVNKVTVWDIKSHASVLTLFSRFFCAEFSMPHMAKTDSAPKLCSVKKAWHCFTSKPTRWSGCHIKTCCKWQNFDVCSRQSDWSQCLTCCFDTKSTQLTVEEGQIRWNGAIIMSSHFCCYNFSNSRSNEKLSKP